MEKQFLLQMPRFSSNASTAQQYLHRSRRRRFVRLLAVETGKEATVRKLIGNNNIVDIYVHYYIKYAINHLKVSAFNGLLTSFLSAGMATFCHCPHLFKMIRISLLSM